MENLRPTVRYKTYLGESALGHTCNNGSEHVGCFVGGLFVTAFMLAACFVGLSAPPESSDDVVILGVCQNFFKRNSRLFSGF